MILRMKKLFQAVFAVVLLVLGISCGKQKSTDLPLTKYHKEALYITTNNSNLISYNPFTGVKNWEIFLRGNCEGVPVLYNKRLYAATNTGWLYGVDVITGDIVLEKQIQSAVRLSMALVGDKLIVASIDSLYSYDLNGNRIWAYDPGSGYSCTSSPQVNNGNVFIGINGTVRSINAANGAGIWASANLGSDILSSPRVSNGLVYFGGQDSKIYALDESTGNLKWEYTTGDKITTSSPMIYGGMCIIGSTDYGIYCIDTTSSTMPPAGELRWEFPTGDKVNSSATVHTPSNTVLIGGHDFNLYAIDHVSGVLKWKYPAGSIIKSSPLVYGEYAYFTAADRYLYCIDVRNGSTVWKSFLNGSTESSPMIDDTKTGVYPGISGMSAH
jgi:outer membrane protein assembly factor BamB